MLIRGMIRKGLWVFSYTNTKCDTTSVKEGMLCKAEK
jgi:hypothetical protein